MLYDYDSTSHRGLRDTSYFGLRTAVTMLSLLLLQATFGTSCSSRSKQRAGIQQVLAPQSIDALPLLTVDAGKDMRTNKEWTVDARTTGAVSWEWTQVSGPGRLTILNPDIEDTVVLADQDGVYELRLTVKDKDGQIAFDEVELVWDSTPPVVALSQEVRAFQSLTLEGVVGSDAVAFQWSQVKGEGQLTFDQATARKTQVAASADGLYILRLTVFDDLGNAAFSDMTLIWDAKAPTVSLGQDLFTNKEITLDALTADAASYRWSQVSGPAPITFGAPNAEDTTIKATLDGTYVLRLTITKASGAEAFDEVTVVWDTQPPLVNMGPNLAGKYRLSIDVSTEGAIAFQWRQQSGPGRLQFSNTSSEDTSIVSDAAGDYEVALEVADAAGNTATGRMLIRFDFDTRLFAKQLASGSAHTCAVLDDDTVSCWGYNYEGELGFGDTTDRYAAPSFTVNVGAGRKVRSVAAGYAHTCALLDNGSVKCWGFNKFGELGYGDLQQRNAPNSQAINLGRPALSVTAGFSHTCALLDDRSVKCWGANTMGQLGHGDTMARNAPRPQAIDFGGNRRVDEVAAGSYHTCARFDDGSVGCWGNNAFGQLGYGDRTMRVAPSMFPVNLGANRSARALAVGAYHSCAVLDDGTVRCWGRNGNGQLGYGDTNERIAPPAVAIDLGAGRTAQAIGAGFAHTCAILDEGSVKCWGGNAEGQLGYADTVTRYAPFGEGLDLGGGRTARGLSVGRNHACVVLDDATVKCWGANSYGQAGYGDTLNRTSPPQEVLEYKGRPAS